MIDLGVRRALSRIVAALVVLVVFAGLGACGAALAPARRADGPDIDRQLAIEEQRLESAQEELDTLDPAACPDRCRAAGSICEASSHICAIARDRGDTETLGRCERAETTCRAAHDVTSACGCTAPAPDAGTV